MIFALVDYVQYALKKGRYGDRQRSTMGLGFRGTPPREVLDQLLAGDLFVTQRLDAWFSWAMMYFSSSPVDHCGMCTGARTVVHTTFSGVTEHPLRYVAKGTRMLLLRPYDWSGFARPPSSNEVTRFWNGWPPKLQLIWAAFQIVLGFYPERFRWRFLADLLILAGLVDFLFRRIEPFPVLSGIVALLGWVALFNKGRWAYRRLKGQSPPEPMSNPDAVLQLSGVLMFTRLGPIVTGPFGVLPLQAVRLMAAGSTSPDADSGPEDLGQWLRDVLERLDIPVADPDPAET